MTFQLCTVAAGVAVLLALSVPVSASPIVGQIDTFEDGGLAGWSVGPGHPAPPTNEANGGPGGVGDNYLRLTSLGGANAGSRLSAFNMAQWAGDYLAAGVTSIEMDLRNDGPDDVVIRLLLAGPFGPFGPDNAVATLDSVFLPAGGSWVHAVFSLRPADLNVLLGTASGALSQAQELRLFHNPAPIFAGPPGSSPPVTAQLGVDNIEAVPEPASVGLIGIAALAGLMRRSRQRAS